MPPRLLLDKVELPQGWLVDVDPSRVFWFTAKLFLSLEGLPARLIAEGDRSKVQSPALPSPLSPSSHGLTGPRSSTLQRPRASG